PEPLDDEAARRVAGDHAHAGALLAQEVTVRNVRILEHEAALGARRGVAGRARLRARGQERAAVELGEGRRVERGARGRQVGDAGARRGAAAAGAGREAHQGGPPKQATEAHPAQGNTKEATRPSGAATSCRSRAPSPTAPADAIGSRDMKRSILILIAASPG